MNFGRKKKARARRHKNRSEWRIRSTKTALHPPLSPTPPVPALWCVRVAPHPVWHFQMSLEDRISIINTSIRSIYLPITKKKTTGSTILGTPSLKFNSKFHVMNNQLHYIYRVFFVPWRRPTDTFQQQKHRLFPRLCVVTESRKTHRGYRPVDWRTSLPTMPSHPEAPGDASESPRQQKLHRT